MNQSFLYIIYPETILSLQKETDPKKSFCPIWMRVKWECIKNGGVNFLFLYQKVNFSRQPFWDVTRCILMEIIYRTTAYVDAICIIKFISRPSFALLAFYLIRVVPPFPPKINHASVCLEIEGNDDLCFLRKYPKVFRKPFWPLNSLCKHFLISIWGVSKAAAVGRGNFKIHVKGPDNDTAF